MQKTHELQIRVRYYETDAMGFLHHSNYLCYFELGRTEMLRAGGGNYREMEESGLYFVVVKMEVRYKSPARYDDVVVLTTNIERVTPARLEHSYTVTRDGEVLAEASSTLACINKSGQATRIPVDMLNISYD